MKSTDIVILGILSIMAAEQTGCMSKKYNIMGQQVFAQTEHMKEIRQLYEYTDTYKNLKDREVIRMTSFHENGA